MQCEGDEIFWLNNMTTLYMCDTDFLMSKFLSRGHPLKLYICYFNVKNLQFITTLMHSIK